MTVLSQSLAQTKSGHGHTPHILPLKLYFAVGGALLVLTAITVVVAHFDLGPLNLTVAMLIAAIKASLVALFFMHLKYDNKLYAVIFVTALLFMAIFIIFTLFDTMTRDEISPEEGGPINPKAVIYEQQSTGSAQPGTVTDEHGESGH